MKKFILILILFNAAFFIGKAQEDFGKKAEKIQALKIAFITQKLELTSDEAQKFWPVYSQYENEMKQLLIQRKNADVIESDEGLLNIRKKYRPEFVRVIGQPRMNQLFNAEREFRGVLLRHLENRANNQQRPMFRRK
ncbi:MAG: hypothetical protein ABJA57_03660 [Ginsengibacter sp.]